MHNYQLTHSESTLPIKPTILRQKKRILRTCQEVEEKQQKNTQHVHTNNKIITAKNKKYQRSFQNSNPRLHTVQKNRTSFGTMASFEQTTARSRYSLVTSAKSRTNLLPDTEIRQQMDEMLENIHKVLGERRLSFDLPNNRINSCKKLRGDQLDRNLVHQYLQLIYRDYEIPQLNQFSESFTDRQYADKYQFLRTQTIEVIQSQLSPKSLKRQVPHVFKSNRKAMQLKKKFIKEMLSSSKTQKKIHPASPTNIKFNKQNTNQKNFKMIHQIHSANKCISQRFCLVCERNLNSEVHQKQKCFKILSEMSIQHLKQALIQNLVRIKNEGEQICKQMFSEEGQRNLVKRLHNFRHSTQNYFALIQKKIDLNRQNSTANIKNELKSNFQKLTPIMTEKWQKLQQCIKKLNWFIFMLIILQEKQNQQ